MTKFNTLNLLKFFLILIPVSIITGSFLADALVFLSMLIFIIFFFRKNISYFLKDKFLFYFLIFFLFILLNSVLNNSSFYSIKTSFTFIRFIFFYLAIVFICEKFGNNFFDKLYHLFLIIFLILFIDSSFEFFFDKNILNFKSSYPGRISSLFGDELILGSYISKFYPLFFYLHIKKFGFQGKLFILLLISCLTYFTILISGERIAFLSINLFYFLLIIYYLRHFFSKKIFLFLVIIFSINASLFIYSSEIKERYFQKTFTQVVVKNEFKVQSSNIKKNSFTDKINNNTFFNYIPYEYRIYFLTSTNIFVDNFFVGTGTKSYRYFCNDKKYVISKGYSCSTHPHNFYFQILAENGIIGFSFLILFNIYGLLMIMKMILNKKINNFSYPLLSGIFVFYFPFIFTGNLFNNMVCIFSFFVIGFYMYEKNKLT